MRRNFLPLFAAVGLLYVSGRCHRAVQWLVPELNLSAMQVTFRDSLWWFLPNAWAVVLADEAIPTYVIDLIRTPLFVVVKYSKAGKDVLLVLRADRETIHAMKGRNEEGWVRAVSDQSPTQRTTWN